MSRFIENILKGFGSIICLYPVTDFQKFVLDKTNEELFEENFQLVGNSLREAVSTINNEQEAPKHTQSH